MIAEELIEKVTERLVERINRANLFVIKKIAKKIKQMGTMNPSNANDIIEIMDYGGDIESIVKEISKETGLNAKDIYTIFEEVAKNDQRFAKKYYEYRKKRYIPWEENALLRNEVEAIAKQTLDTYVNLSNTRGIGYTIKELVYDEKTKKYKEKTVFNTISDLYKKVVDEGILSMSEGKTTFNEEMSKLMSQIGRSGLKYLDYESGYSRRLDSALRMNISDGLKQLHNKTQEVFGKEFDSDGVEITVHEFPAPDHELVQGRQFRNEEFEKFQNDEDCKDVTGKEFTADFNGHDRRSISEYNCKHYIFSIIVGVSTPEYSEEELQEIIDRNRTKFEFEGKEYTKYEGTQLQRKIETEIRRTKDIQIMATESGEAGKQLAEDSQRKIDSLTTKYYELSKVSGISPQIDRLQVDGYNMIKLQDDSSSTPKLNRLNRTSEQPKTTKPEENKEKWLDYENLPRWYQGKYEGNGKWEIDEEGKELIDYLNDYGYKDSNASKIFSNNRVAILGTSDGTHESTYIKYQEGKGQFRRERYHNQLIIDRISDKKEKVGTVNTTLHENWHAIDYLNSDDRSSFMSNSSYKLSSAISNDNGEIGKPVKELFEEYNKGCKEISLKVNEDNKHLWTELTERYKKGEIKYSTYRSKWNTTRNHINFLKEYEERNYMGGGYDLLQDIYDALSKGKFRDEGIVKFGHGSKYYKKMDNRCEEIFANYGALSMTNPRLIELLKEDKPELCNVLEEMMEDILWK